jgi:glyoxylase-like metal-dependent hydrolase (beta-lactamase superfamily II)
MLKISRFGAVARIDTARNLPVLGEYWTTAYLVDGLLIDTGCAHAAPELVRELENLPLSRIVNTHAHEDHIGGNGPLQTRRDGMQILIHELGLPVLADPKGLQPLQPYRKLFWGWPEPSVALSIADGDVISTDNHSFHMIHTPGHSSDHCCLYEPEEGWLFSGDLYVGGHERALRVDYDIWGILASLKRIAELPSRMLFPGSARVRENPEEVLRAKITHLEQMGERIFGLHKKGWSVQKIVRAVCGKPMFLELFTLGHFSRRGLVLSYLRRN